METREPLPARLPGTAGAGIALLPGAAASPGAGLPPTDDPVFLRQMMRPLLEDPIDRRRLEHAARELVPARTPAPDARTLATRAARVLDSGGDGPSLLTRGGSAVGRAGTGPAAAAETAGQTTLAGRRPDTPPSGKDEKTRDWYLECGHHAEGSRAVFPRGSRIAVVPEKSAVRDLVKLHWRDDFRDAMPKSLTVQPSGRPATQIMRSGSSGRYATYSLDAEFLGDRDIFNFLLPSFWKAFGTPTYYRIDPGPTGVDVQVYNPRRFGVKLSFPPTAKISAGSKYETDARVHRQLAKPGKITGEFEASLEQWSPSKLQYRKDSFTSESGGRTGSAKVKAEKPLRYRTPARSLSLTRDDVEVELDFLKALGAFLRFHDTMKEIVQTFRDYAPKVGWYFEWELQIFQGEAGAEWYWKEHTDHEVFRYVDFYLALKVLSITLEAGLGISACSFKAQVFVQLTGELGVEAGACRDKPSLPPELRFPDINGLISGAVGARFEAAYVFKAEGKGETGIEVQLAVGINRRESIMDFNLRARWTGLKCTLTYSVGLFGIGGTKTSETEIIPASGWIGLEAPRETRYEPPFVSRDRIQEVLESVLRKGLNIRVIRSSGNILGLGDVRWSIDEIASAIADRVEKHTTFDKTPRMVDALANAVRADLEVLGEHWGRDWVEEADFRSYLDRSIRGLSLSQRLEDSARPTAALVAARGGGGSW